MRFDGGRWWLVVAVVNGDGLAGWREHYAHLNKPFRSIKYLNHRRYALTFGCGLNFVAALRFTLAQGSRENDEDQDDEDKLLLAS